MKLPHSVTSTPHPFVLWLNLATQTSEMLVASGQVISHRLTRLALAGINPNARDRKEFTLMGQEKVEAAAESLQAMTSRLMKLGQQTATQTMRYWMDATLHMSSLLMSPSFAQSASRQTAWMQTTMRTFSSLLSRSLGDLAGLAQHGLKPIHTRATGNARRLSIVSAMK